MDNLQRVKKYKKRKTRKHLDELRKRSKNEEKKKKKNEKPLNEEKIKRSIKSRDMKNNNFLTKDRLTLKMFPKAIHSDTIKRPGVSTSNNSNLTIKNNNVSTLTSKNIEKPEKILQNNSIKSNYYIIKGNVQSDMHDFIFHDKVKTNDHIFDKNNILNFAAETSESIFNTDDKVCENENKENTFKEVTLGEKDSPTSLVLFTTQNETNSNQNSSMLEDYSSPLLTSQELHAYEIYKDIMNGMETLLINEENNHIEHKINNVYKLKLQKLFTESHEYQSSQMVEATPQRDFTTISSSLNMIVQNPKEYLKYGDPLQQDENHLIKSTNSTLSSQCSPLIQQSHMNSNSKSPSYDTLSQSVMLETPEYYYYPHKLNE